MRDFDRKAFEQELHDLLVKHRVKFDLVWYRGDPARLELDLVDDQGLVFDSFEFDVDDVNPEYRT